MEYAGKKVASVRGLKRTSAPIVHAVGVHEPRVITPILGGILATEPSWNPPFGEPFSACLASSAPDKRLDLGCVAAAGAFEAVYDDSGHKVIISHPDVALASFFMWLLHRLQRIGTVPAIEYADYLKAFESPR